MALSDVRVRNAKPRSKPYKITDGDGLFLLIQPSGSKYWRLKYFYFGKEKSLALGVYPEICLGDARERRTQARKALAAGTDPGEVKKQAKRLAALKNDNAFETVAREWYEQRKHAWVPNYSSKVIGRFENYVFPKLGKRPIAVISAPEILTMLRVIENTGALETVRIVKQMCGQVFMYAIATGRAERNPVPDLNGAFKTPIRKHHAHLNASDLPAFLQTLEAYRGSVVMKLAMRFLLLTFVRNVELRAAKWSEVDFSVAEWRISADRMKMREQHIVPLSRQAIEVLQELKKQTGIWPHLFPNPRKPLSHVCENAIANLLDGMGYATKATSHGFRATASTILNEKGFSPDVIERQLAHCERNKVRAAYNHAEYLAERRNMMQWWADYLDEAAKKPVEAKY